MTKAVVPMPQELAAAIGGLADVIYNSFFEYAINFVPLAANANGVPGTILIQSDAHFICVMSMFEADDTAMGPITDPTGGTLIQLSDVSGNRFLSNIPVPAVSLFGTAQRPFVWPFTHLFRANGSLQLSVTDTTGAAQNVRYVFAGYKIPVSRLPNPDAIPSGLFGR